MASKTILAAGGIVVRNGARRLIAVVQRSKDDAWVLPRGKLKRDENPVSGARREVIEETGHQVRVHEFLGAITYRARGRPKVVQFWRMQAAPRPSHEVMPDIVAVEWLPLKAAVRRLSYPLEKLFLRNVGAAAIPRRKRRVRRKLRTSKPKSTKKSARKTANKTDKNRARRRTPARSHKRKTESHGAKSKSRARKSHTAARKPIAHRPAVAKHAVSGRAAPKRGALKRVLHRHVAIKPVPAATHPVPRSTASRSASLAEHKTILQRMLGRLAR